MSNNAYHRSPLEGAKRLSETAWTDHEHTSPELQIRAQQLIAEAGSPGLARQALDAAPTDSGVDHKDHFAQHWGCDTFSALCGNSYPVQAGPGRVLCLTHLANQQWLVWDLGAVSVVGTFATLREAEDAILRLKGRTELT